MSSNAMLCSKCVDRRMCCCEQSTDGASEGGAGRVKRVDWCESRKSREDGQGEAEIELVQRIPACLLSVSLFSTEAATKDGDDAEGFVVVMCA